MTCSSTLLSSLKVELCPDVVKWIDDDRLLCGTYEVVDDGKATSVAYDMNRKGSLIIMNTENGLEIAASLNTDAIFDMKVAAGLNHFLLAVADAKGKLTLYEISKDNDFNVIKNLQVYKNHLAVCIDWKSSANEVLVTGSDGSVSRVKINASDLSIADTWKAHGFEAWTAIYDTVIENVIYTGGDDSMFLSWDLRDTQKPISRNKSHNAGICCILCNGDNRLVTGSYDEYVRIWDKRKFQHPLFEKKLDGGVWKLSWHPKSKDLMVATCMYEGTKIINIINDKIEVSGVVTDPGPLSYGADWLPSIDNHSTKLATCTFYDKIVKIHKISNLSAS